MPEFKLDLKDLEGELLKLKRAGKAAKVELSIADADADSDMDAALIINGRKIGHIELSKITGALSRFFDDVQMEAARLADKLNNAAKRLMRRKGAKKK